MKAFSILRVLRKFDDYGYPINLRYKGEKTYQSFFGGVLTLLVKVLTLILVIIGLQKGLVMTDPNITSFPRPVSADERQSLTENGLKFKDYDFNIGLRVRVTDLDGNEFSELPLEYARMYAHIRNKDDS